MQQPAVPVNELSPLVNVSNMLAATKRATARPRHLPGLIAYYGPAGWGKTCAATFTANTLDCFHVQILDFWNRTEFLRQVCIELGLAEQLKKRENRTIAAMGAMICETLGMSQKPLIIDEVDLAIQKGYIETVRAIFEGSKTTVVLIGEESLPKDLLKWERIHSRVLEWVPAQPPDLQDAATLAHRYSRDGITITDDMIRKIHTASGTSVRRICVNIERVQEFARENGFTTVDSKAWGNQPLYTGAAPTRSAAAHAAGMGR